MSTANLEVFGFGAVELGVEVDAVTRMGNKASLVLVAGRMVGVNGYKCVGEVEVTAGPLDRRPPRWRGWSQGYQAATEQWVALGKARERNTR